jgi:four helix bundle protein
MSEWLNFDEWQKTVLERLRKDQLWESQYYRLAMYLYDLAWDDCEILRNDYRGREIVGQLIRSAGSICANLEEAYGRGVGTPDYVRIMKIDIGEIREAQGWYFRSRRILPPDLLEHRLSVINQVLSYVINTLNSHRRNLRKT